MRRLVTVGERWVSLLKPRHRQPEALHIFAVVPGKAGLVPLRQAHVPHRTRHVLPNCMPARPQSAHLEVRHAVLEAVDDGLALPRNALALQVLGLGLGLGGLDHGHLRGEGPGGADTALWALTRTEQRRACSQALTLRLALPVSMNAVVVLPRCPTFAASAFSTAATRMRLAALISFMASLTLVAGSMSVTSTWMMEWP